jgi:hypothetical protein
MTRKIIMADKPQKKTWKTPQVDLSQALEEWSTISQTVKEEGKIAPDQKVLKEIAGLLLELKSKLEEFAAPAEETAPKKTENQEVSL